ncbi:hypothetical protein [Streptomyces sp. OV198]|uniref:hypothetical protein n=1 Tax=Streptomyces sp. OV198 TaxID=1882787 RepID=UPI00359CADE8
MGDARGLGRDAEEAFRWRIGSPGSGLARWRAKVFADAGNDVLVRARRDEVADAINTRHQNPRYLPDVLRPPASERRRTRRLPSPVRRT